MKIFSTDWFVLPLPADHRFPMQKYALLHEQVAIAGLVPPARLQVPPAVSDAQIRLAHTPDYLRRVVAGLLTPSEIRRIGFPWSPELVERSRRASGGTLAAARAALDTGYGANLAGGTHHAFPNRGEGYCVLNDSVITARVLQAEGLVERVLIVDLDVHQGNGTAAMVQNDPTIFSLSVHGASNFPFHKETSDLDIALPDGTGDVAYLEAVEDGLHLALQTFPADLVIYLAGADPYQGDRLGRLKVSKAGLATRDRLVLDYCRTAGLPVAVTMGGGYAPDVRDIVAIHFQTIATVCKYAGTVGADGADTGAAADISAPR